MGCQTKIVEKILKKGGNYVIGLKGNQENLHKNVKEIFVTNASNNYQNLSHTKNVTTEKGHGRTETRTVIATTDLSSLNEHKFEKINSIVRVDHESTNNISKKHSSESRYYITNLTTDATRLAAYIRKHWGIENSCHYVLDVAMNEDSSRVRKDNAPHNLATLRKIALNILRSDLHNKKSIRRKQLLVAGNPTYLINLFTQIFNA